MALTDEQIDDAANRNFTTGNNLTQYQWRHYAHAIESAATAPLLEQIAQHEETIIWQAAEISKHIDRIAQLEQQLAEAHKYGAGKLRHDFAVPADFFEQVIREFGVVAACEWFGHAPDSEFTKETEQVLAERAAIAQVNAKGGEA